MSVPAFYKPGDFSSTVILDGAEAHHAEVLRIGQGEKIQIFNGQGVIAQCVIRSVGKKKLAADVLDIIRFPPPLSRPILALAASKAVRRNFFMEKAAELGAAEIWVWEAERSVGKLTGKVLEGCAQQLIAGGKQSRNPWFPQLVDCRNMAGLLKKSSTAEIDCRLLPWEEKAGENLISFSQLGRPGNTIYVIGPEGGLAQVEADVFMAEGFQTVGLGERVLRCETAALLCLGLHMWASQLRKSGEAA